MKTHTSHFHKMRSAHFSTEENCDLYDSSTACHPSKQGWTNGHGFPGISPFSHEEWVWCIGESRGRVPVPTILPRLVGPATCLRQRLILNLIFPCLGTLSLCHSLAAEPSFSLFSTQAKPTPPTNIQQSSLTMISSFFRPSFPSIPPPPTVHRIILIPPIFEECYGRLVAVTPVIYFCQNHLRWLSDTTTRPSMGKDSQIMREDWRVLELSDRI